VPIDLVIFDNDGVTVDSELLANRVLSDLLTEHGHPTTIEECIHRYMGGTLAAVRASVKEQSGQQLPAGFDDEYHARLFEAFERDLRPVPGIEAVLRHLSTPFCLASSGTFERIARSLTVTGMLDYFEGRIFSAEQVPHGKPAPHPTGKVHRRGGQPQWRGGCPRGRHDGSRLHGAHPGRPPARCRCHLRPDGGAACAARFVQLTDLRFTTSASPRRALRWARALGAGVALRR
jgi:beta-phosphoglucomutase-like phosphatase (HAD superfamily)